MRHNEDILFRDWQWGECLNYLNNVVHHSDNIVLISGELDSGKTTLKQEVINSLPDNFKTFAMYGEPRLGVATFMRQITIGFGLPWDLHQSPDWNELRKAIFSQPNVSWLLLIDDAEKLSWDTLNALINLYVAVSAEVSNFSLILFADVSLSSNIKNSVLKDFFETKFHIVELRSLTLEEMTIFLRDCMQLTFDRKTLKKIYNASNGVIGKIKQLAISELNVKNTGKNLIKNLLEHVISPPVMRVGVCGGLLFVAYILFGITQKKHVNTIELAAQQETPKAEQNIQLAHNEREPTLDPKLNIPTIIDKAQYDQLYQQLHIDLKNSLQEQLSNLQAELAKLQAQITALPLTANQAPAAKQLIAATPTKMTNLNKKSINIVKTNSLQINNTEKQLLKIAKNRYALQLMASKNEYAAKKLIDQHPILSKKAKYFSGKFTPKDDIWFLVVHGVYDSRELAIKDIKNLPTALQKLRPVVRDYASVHQLINNK